MQRVFDVRNEQDVRDLFDILPDNATVVEKVNNNGEISVGYDNKYDETTDLFKIEWGDAEEIARPAPEVTKKDTGKLCMFWDLEKGVFGKGTLYSTAPGMTDENANDYRYIGKVFDSEICLIPDNVWKIEKINKNDEATEADIGKLCVFWDDTDNSKYGPSYGILEGINKEIKEDGFKYLSRFGYLYKHCRRLTKEEIENLC